MVSVVPYLNPTSHESGSARCPSLHAFTADEFEQLVHSGVLADSSLVKLEDEMQRVTGIAGHRWHPPKELKASQKSAVRLRRFAVDEYHRLLNCGVLHPTLRTELLDGWVVDIPVASPPHATSLQLTAACLRNSLPSEWGIRVRCGVTFTNAELEPDIAVVASPMERYANAHPSPADIALVIEIADTSLAYERGPKLRDYARNGIPAYWIVNVIDRVVECHADPDRSIENPTYRQCRIVALNEILPPFLEAPPYSIAAAGFFPPVR